MDKREADFRQFLIEQVESLRQKYPNGYLSLEMCIDSHQNPVTTAIEEPTIKCTFYHQNLADGDAISYTPFKEAGSFDELNKLI